MTTYDMLITAAKQSAVDCCCTFDDIFSENPSFHESSPSGKERKYLKLPHILDIVSYGHGAVVSGSVEAMDAVRGIVEKYETMRLFETPRIYELNSALRPLGAAVCFMAEYWLPDTEALYSFDRSCKFNTRILTPDEFSDLYLPQWSNALCKDRKELDTLAVGAYEDDELIGLAGCSADCETMMQIGIDILPHYRHRGVASMLTNILAKECIERGKVPFYCCAWSNVASARNAMRAGFKPAWCEITAKSFEYMEKDMNVKLS